MRQQTVFMPSGAFTDVETSPHVLGQLGAIVYDKLTKSYYQYVKMSSTAGDSDTTAPVATKLARWKDARDYTVCSDNVGQGERNLVAGIFISAITAGKYGWIRKSGKAIVAAAASTGSAVGAILTDDNGTGGTCLATANGTAAVKGQVVGIILSVSGDYSSTAPLAKLELIKE